MKHKGTDCISLDDESLEKLYENESSVFNEWLTVGDTGLFCLPENLPFDPQSFAEILGFWLKNSNVKTPGLKTLVLGINIGLFVMDVRLAGKIEERLSQIAGSSATDPRVVAVVLAAMTEEYLVGRRFTEESILEAGEEIMREVTATYLFERLPERWSVVEKLNLLTAAGVKRGWTGVDEARALKNFEYYMGYLITGNAKTLKRVDLKSYTPEPELEVLPGQLRFKVVDPVTVTAVEKLTSDWKEIVTRSKITLEWDGPLEAKNVADALNYVSYPEEGDVSLLDLVNTVIRLSKNRGRSEVLMHAVLEDNKKAIPSESIPVVLACMDGDLLKYLREDYGYLTEEDLVSPHRSLVARVIRRFVLERKSPYEPYEEDLLRRVFSHNIVRRLPAEFVLSAMATYSELIELPDVTWSEDQYSYGYVEPSYAHMYMVAGAVPEKLGTDDRHKMAEDLNDGTLSILELDKTIRLSP